jgi:hypothetical protein
VKHGKKFPREVIDHWPEVFGDITLNVIPLKYLDRIKVLFKNGKIWEINLNNKRYAEEWPQIEKQLREMMAHYEPEIENIDFKLDTIQIKKDMIKSSNRFLKKRKLL